MRFILFLSLGCLFIGLQTTIFQALPKWIGVPDLLFLLIIFIALRASIAQGVLLMMIWGTIMGVLSGYFSGLYTIAYLLIFVIVKALSMGLSIDEINHQPPIVALSYLLANGIIYIFSSMLASSSLTPWLWGEILQRLLIITILVIPAHKVFSLLWNIGINNKDNGFPTIFRSKQGNRRRTVRR
ncbi:MAG TPA: hypothetical protein ENK33_06965 [Desulfobacterales bacterium]|nr:hypothetical protein [Desulfobacterales bacterium]